jgi:hypothetical protein
LGALIMGCLYSYKIVVQLFENENEIRGKVLGSFLPILIYKNKIKNENEISNGVRFRAISFFIYYKRK